MNEVDNWLWHTQIHTDVKEAKSLLNYMRRCCCCFIFSCCCECDPDVERDAQRRRRVQECVSSPSPTDKLDDSLAEVPD